MVMEQNERKQCAAALKVQACYRGMIGREYAAHVRWERRRRKDEMAATTVQSAYRQYAHFRLWLKAAQQLTIKRDKERTQAARRIQALIRGRLASKAALQRARDARKQATNHNAGSQYETSDSDFDSVDDQLAERPIDTMNPHEYEAVRVAHNLAAEKLRTIIHGSASYFCTGEDKEDLAKGVEYLLRIFEADSYGFVDRSEMQEGLQRLNTKLPRTIKLSPDEMDLLVSVLGGGSPEVSAS